MPVASRSLRKWLIGTAIGAAAVVGSLAYLVTSDCEICLAQTVPLKGTVAQNCTITVTAYGDASNLPISVAGAQRVNIGRVVQSCNKKIGYYLRVASARCAAAPVGAKVVDTVPEPDEYLVFSVEFDNPSGADALGLLDAACDDTDNLGRDVSNQKISSETSEIWINFTGDAALGAGEYTDTLTFTMSVKT